MNEKPTWCPTWHQRVMCHALLVFMSSRPQKGGPSTKLGDYTGDYNTLKKITNLRSKMIVTEMILN